MVNNVYNDDDRYFRNMDKNSLLNAEGYSVAGTVKSEGTIDGGVNVASTLMILCLTMFL